MSRISSQGYLQIEVPIYYKKSYATKPAKTFLVSLNFARTAHYYLQNEVKQWYHEYLIKQITASKFKPITAKYEIALVYHYKNAASDTDNVCSQVLKYASDALQSTGIIINDNVKHVHQICMYTGEQDKTNPRVTIYVREHEEET